jgi:hypothetical protein
MARPRKNNKIHVNRRHSSVEAVAAYDSLDLKVCFDIYGRILKSTPWLFYGTVGGDGLPSLPVCTPAFCWDPGPQKAFKFK